MDIKGYKCWRITGKIEHSIERCPVGTKEECLSLRKDETCKASENIIL